MRAQQSGHIIIFMAVVILCALAISSVYLVIQKPNKQASDKAGGLGREISPTLTPLALTNTPIPEPMYISIMGESNEKNSTHTFNDALDINQIVQEKSIPYSIDKIHLTFDYPESQKVVKYDNEILEGRSLPHFEFSDINEGYSLVVSPLPDNAETELFDGLSIEIYYQEAKNHTYDDIYSIVYNEMLNQPKTEDYENYTVSKQMLNGNPVILEHHLTGTNLYYLLDKSGRFIITIYCYYTNSPRRDYKPLHDKIISSVSLGD